MGSVSERLASARAQLEAAGLPPADAALDAEVLARHLLGWDRAALLVHGRDPEPPDFGSRLTALITRRAAREPVAQIVGAREFWGLDFEVTRDVLVPRPETELIVEEAVAFAASSPCHEIVDVGTGSGCLAVSIACELPRAHITAVDVSAAALEVARRNAARHSVAERITFVQTSLFDGLSTRADLIVANPPYVPDQAAAHLQVEVVRYEPHQAVFGGRDGLEVMRPLLRDAGAYLAPQGRLVVEFGFGQEDAVRTLAEEAGWTVLRVREDLQGIPRTLVLSR